jgi:hypothetical protein
MESQVINIATDWWMFSATIGAGLLTTIATIAAVYYTNKWTSERYEQDKIYQNKKNNLVIIKPVLRFCSFSKIIDEMITYNMRERILVVSSEKDGFDFYDDDNKLYSLTHRIFCIKNEAQHQIHSVKIDVNSRITTESNATIDDNYSNFIKLLRNNEEIILRAHSTKQRNKLWEELENNRQVELWFNCSINYLTNADEQVCYQYEAKIQNIPGPRSEYGVSNNAKISIIKDEFKILDKITLNRNEKPSVFRNIQDNILIDRVSYTHKKIGEAQAQGLMSQIIPPFGKQVNQNDSYSNKSKANETENKVES